MKKTSHKTIDYRLHLHIFKTLLLTLNIAFLIIYAIMHLVFYDLPFEIKAEGIIALKILTIGTVFAAGASFIFLFADVIEYLLHSKKHIKWTTMDSRTAIATASILVILFILLNV